MKFAYQNVQIDIPRFKICFLAMFAHSREQDPPIELTKGASVLLSPPLRVARVTKPSRCLRKSQNLALNCASIRTTTPPGSSTEILWYSGYRQKFSDCTI
jgi:hypothetical protein